jgi:Na+/melibiose symporter-like transporter
VTYVNAHVYIKPVRMIWVLPIGYKDLMKRRALPTNARTWASILYAGPALARTFVLLPVLTLLPSILVQDVGMAAGTVAVILTAARLLDLILDPVVGAISDIQGGGSARAPMMALGLAPLSIGAVLAFGYFGLGPGTLTLGLALLFLGWTMIEVPHRSLAVDLEVQVDRRMALIGAREALSFVSTLIALAVLFALGTQSDTVSVQPFALFLIAITALTVLPLTAYLRLLPKRQRQQMGSSRSNVMIALVRTARKSKAFLTAVFLFATAASMGASLHLIVLRSLFGIAELLVPLLLLEAICGFLVAISGRRLLSQVPVWKSGSIGAILCGGMTLLLLPLAQMSPAMLIAITTLRTIPFTIVLLAVWQGIARISDDVSEDGMRSSAGLVHGFSGALAKLGLVAGPFLGIMLSGLFAIAPPDPAGSAAAANSGILIAYAGFPGLIFLASAFFFSRQRLPSDASNLPARLPL